MDRDETDGLQMAIIRLAKVVTETQAMALATQEITRHLLADVASLHPEPERYLAELRARVSAGLGAGDTHDAPMRALALEKAEAILSAAHLTPDRTKR